MNSLVTPAPLITGAARSAPSTRPPFPPPPRVPRPLLAGGWVLAATVLQLVRSPGVPSWRAVFGEDGGIFLTDAIAHPGISALLTPYQGYLQLAPRLVAALAAALPVSAAAAVLAILPAAVVAALSLYVYDAGRTVFRERRSRAALALVVVLLPVGYDIDASATNLHWYLDFACCWVFLAPVRHRRDIVVGALVVGLAALSDPLVVLATPLAVGWLVRQRRSGGAWPATRPVPAALVVSTVFVLGLLAQAATVALRQAPTALVVGLAALSDPLVVLATPLAVGWLVRQRRSGGAWPATRPVPAALVVPTVFVLGLVAQAATVALRQSPSAFVQVDLADLPTIYGVRVPGSLLFGDRGLTAVDRLVGATALLATATVLGGVVLVALLVGRRLGARGLVRVLTLLSVLWLVVPLVLRGTGTLLDVDAVPLPGSRYIVNPFLWLTAALLLAFEAPRGPTRRRRPQVLLALVLALGIATSIRLPAQRSAGPTWSDGLASARSLCAATGDRPAAGGRSAEYPWGRPPGPGDALVPVAPHGRVPSWSVVLPCSRLR